MDKAFQATLLLALVVNVFGTACPCPKILSWVCGDDGISYQNDCLAQCAKVTVAYPGQCVAGAKKQLPKCGKKPVECIVAPCSVTKSECKKRSDLVCLNSYCPVKTILDGATIKGGCSAVFVTKKAGLVVKGCLPGAGCICTEIYQPVCGTDGKTYSNPCAAACYRIPVKYKGECKIDCTRVRCGNAYNPVCGKDGKTYENKCKAECSFNATVSYEGQCKPNCLAVTCSTVVDPVCGKDGKTYNNDCIATCSGALINYKGECKKACKCKNTGNAVCGKDGVTYKNSCRAGCAGVAVAYKGKCKPPSSTQIACGKNDPGARCAKDPCKGPGSCDGKGNAVCLQFYCTRSVTFQGVKLSTPCSAVFVDKNTGVIIPCK